MSVGPGKIRSWSAEPSPPKKKLLVVKKKPAPGEPKLIPNAAARVVKASSPPANPAKTQPTQKPARPPAKPAHVATKPSFQPQKRHPALEPIRIELKLLLNERQRTTLEALFRAPRVLANLLRDYPQQLTTKADASGFLLHNRRQLDGVINPERREHDVDLLTELLLQWAGNPPESVGIDFEDVSLTLDSRVYLPLPGLRAVEVLDVEKLKEQREGRRPTVPFTLFEEDKRFFVALTLEPRGATAPRPAQKGPHRNQHLDENGKVKEIKLKPGQPLPYISGPRYTRREPRQRVLFSRYSGVFTGSIKTMNWGDLSGWGVNGGLPSLGKRAR